MALLLGLRISLLRTDAAVLFTCEHKDLLLRMFLGLPWWSSGLRIHLSMQEMRVRSLRQDDPWRRKWLPTPVFLPGEPHRQRSLARYSPQGRKESDTTEHTHMPEPQSWNWGIMCAFSFVPKIFLAGDAGSLTAGKLGLRGAGGRLGFHTMTFDHIQIMSLHAVGAAKFLSRVCNNRGCWPCSPHHRRVT